MMGGWQDVVFDCEDPDSGASFSEQLQGMTKIQHDADGWVVIGDAADAPAAQPCCRVSG